MFKNDFDDFEALLVSTAELMGKNPPKSAQVAMFFRVMARYSIEDIRSALEAHLRDSDRGRFFPAPADLIAKIDARQDPRPDWANRLCQGHVGGHALPAGIDDHPGTPRPGISASR